MGNVLSGVRRDRESYEFWLRVLVPMVQTLFAGGVSYYIIKHALQENKGAQMTQRTLEKLKRCGRSEDLIEDSYEAEFVRDLVVDPVNLSRDFSDIGGLAVQKEQIQRALVLPLTRPDCFDAADSKGADGESVLGVLFVGPPGTGKTMMAECIAKEAPECVYMHVKMSALMDKWAGETEKRVAAFWRLARKLSPAILFMDEIDTVFKTRGESSWQSPMRTQMQGEFFQALSGGPFGNQPGQGRVALIAATNRPEDLDPALMRRFQSFVFGLPTQEEREQILARILISMKVSQASLGELQLPSLAARTQYYSGSDLRMLCEKARTIVCAEAARQSVPASRRRAISARDLETALEECRVMGLGRPKGRGRTEMAEELAADPNNAALLQLSAMLAQMYAGGANSSGRNVSVD